MAIPCSVMEQAGNETGDGCVTYLLPALHLSPQCPLCNCYCHQYDGNCLTTWWPLLSSSPKLGLSFDKVSFCEMLKHCPSLRMEREVELHGKVSIEGLVEKETHTTSENDTVCPSCGGQHRRLRVYRASPASHHQQEQNSTMDFTTVPLSPTTTSAMVVEESLRRFCQLWPMNIFHIEILPGFTWTVQTLDYSPWWSSWGTRTPGRRGSPARRSPWCQLFHKPCMAPAAIGSFLPQMEPQTSINHIPRFCPK